MLDYYKKPSSASLKIIQSGKVTVQGTTIDLSSEKEKTFVARLADALDLDQVQAFVLLRSFIRQEVASQFQIHKPIVVLIKLDL